MDEDTNIFEASVSDVRPIASMLRSIAFKNSLKALVEINQHGMKVTVEEGRSVQAHAYLNSQSFTTYSFVPPATPSPIPSSAEQDNINDEELIPSVSFEIHLSALLECLNIFGNASPLNAPNAWLLKKRAARYHSEDEDEAQQKPGRRTNVNTNMNSNENKITAARMSYAGTGYPLLVLLEDSGVVTRCEITTYETEDGGELGFDDRGSVQRVIMRSEWLRDAFNEIDPSSEKISILFSPPEHQAGFNRFARGVQKVAGGKGNPTFRLESFGTLGSTEMDYPNDKDVLETFECDKMIKNAYKFSHLLLTSKALNASSKVSIRTAEDGLISFQFMIPLGKTTAGVSKDGFVEFICVPLEHQEDELA